ncbi:DUF6961 family protein [Sphingomonas mucosissima]|uniref:Uncharacterized protein n=1 Tax=Sphingomonas mucosissima TaxID=370959 RepID=A0A245ZE39_9SPHN|nr:hypothetical protein SPMU_32240 [Sphingomonas mucosissima]
MTPEQERWAEALAIERMYGTEAAAWVANRIRALSVAGERAGVVRFQQIAMRLHQLRRGDLPT